MQFRVITISGEVGSGKSTTVRELAKLLPDWRTVNTGQRFREFCASRQMSIQQVSTLPDEVHREFDDDQRNLIAHETQVIVEGRLAGWLARDMEDVFRVWCQAPLHERVLRVSIREDIPTGQALSELEYRDKGDLEKYRRVYGLNDYRAPMFYHLVLNTSQYPAEMLAQQILKKADLKR